MYQVPPVLCKINLVPNQNHLLLSYLHVILTILYLVHVYYIMSTRWYAEETLHKNKTAYCFMDCTRYYIKCTKYDVFNHLKTPIAFHRRILKKTHTVKTFSVTKPLLDLLWYRHTCSTSCRIIYNNAVCKVKTGRCVVSTCSKQVLILK